MKENGAEVTVRMRTTNSWVCDVVSANALNECVQRVAMSNDMSIDVPRSCLEVSVSDRLKIELMGGDGRADCILQGQVYDNLDGFSYISCGGLLAKIANNRLQANSLVKIGISKNRRRRRDDK